MPLYNYKCNCGYEFEAFEKMLNRALSKCLFCGQMAKQTISNRPAAVHGFKYGEFRDITYGGVYVKGKRHLQVLCDENECYAPGMLD